MSHSSLQALEQSLSLQHFAIIEKQSGNGYDIAGLWLVKNPHSSETQHIVFEGTAENNAVVLSSAYGCYLQNHPEVQLYLNSQGLAFKQQLQQFMQQLQMH
jgi:hypothetical protein